MIVDGDVESRENRDFGCGPPNEIHPGVNPRTHLIGPG